MMLRIISKQQGTTYRLELHGTVAGEWIAVLEHHWRDILYAVPFRHHRRRSLQTWFSSIAMAKSCSAGWRSAPQNWMGPV